MSATTTSLRRDLHAARAEMARLTSELVAIPTENPPGKHYAACRRLLVAQLKRLGFRPQIHGECVLAFCGSGRRTLYFHGHYDVVPAQSRAQFQPMVKGTNLFGRGSSDMKSGLVAMMYAASAAAECDGRIGLVFVPDEETGGARGSQFLTEGGLLGRDGVGMLTAEPTGGAVWNGNRGAISMRVTLRGKHAHVGLQHLGVNAFDKAFDVIAALRALKSKVEKNGSILMLGGRAEGGTGFNAVPSEFSFTLDRRTNPGQSLAVERERLLRAIGDAEVEVLQVGESSHVSEQDPLSKALAASVKEVTGRAPAFEMCPGLLENRWYASRGIPALAYGPGLLTVSHGPREFVPIRNIVECAEIYALTALRFFNADNISSA